MTLVVVPHNPAWHDAFVDEANVIVHALGATAVDLQHIGSTAIRNIAAKPIIDMLLFVRDLDELDGKTAMLEAMKYEAKGEFGIVGRRYFRKDDAHGVRTHHLHAFRSGDPEGVRHIAFRDYMNAHPDCAAAYGHLKLTLAAQHANNAEAYIDGKDAFVKEHERKALAWFANIPHGSQTVNATKDDIMPKNESPVRRKAAPTDQSPVLLAGGNPQIAMADGDAPVQAYIAAMPGWKRDIGRRLDVLVARNAPNARKAVKWNSPFYGIEGQGWFMSFHVFTNYVKVTFFKGTSLRPAPTGGGAKEARWIDVHETDIDEVRLAEWIQQAAAIPGWGKN